MQQNDSLATARLRACVLMLGSAHAAHSRAQPRLLSELQGAYNCRPPHGHILQQPQPGARRPSPALLMPISCAPACGAQAMATSRRWAMLAIDETVILLTLSLYHH